MDDMKIVPPSQKDLKLRERIKEYRHKLPDIVVSPFNKNNWESPDWSF